VTRIKIMCDLDISEKRKPQDGKIKFRKFGPLDIELRVATIPSQGGVEDVVMRILASGEPMPIDKLGLSGHNLARLKQVIAKPYGLFFVCGPTGSGKTTTLHSILSFLNKPDTKIWTAEDPVEITQKGLRQVQVNRKAGLDFATVMRSFLRADPDIIMVGEMRDHETVSIGIEASLTGHLVFATLHTNSAPESITRLLEMGMDPFNFADALLGVLAQRLTKRLCTECRKPHVASDEEIDDLLREYSEELKNTDRWKGDAEAAFAAIRQEWRKSFANERGEIILYQPVGCERCADTGYRGRVGLHELLIGSDQIKQNIQEHARVATILATSLNEGMRTLKQDGIEKVLAGLTDIHQVRAVCIK
jgi:type II secretory ATPase GspE/PulE/Tfp pilus assembly ATPase PilB-like protein